MSAPPDLGPEFNAAREHLRATVLDVIDDGMHDGDPLKCLATVATALLGAATIERDALAAEVKRLLDEVARRDNERHDEYIASCVKDCHCEGPDVPCAGATSSGFCDRVTVPVEDDRPWHDPEADEPPDTW